MVHAPLRSPALAALVVIVACGCERGARVASPAEAQGPPAFPGPGTFQKGPVDGASPVLGGGPSPSPIFVKTDDSNAWVTKTFVVQPKYARVLVVSGAPAPARIEVPPLDLNATPDQRAAPVGYAVAASFATIQEAVGAAHGGDLVAVMPGHYAGFFVGAMSDAGDGRYLHVRAMGRPGEVVVDRPNAVDPKWMILIQRAHHVILEGFAIAGANDDTGSNPSGPNAGVFLDGDFGQSSVMTHHVAIVNVFSHHHRMWGLHSTDTHSVLIEDSLFAFSAREHGAYVSDGSDNYVIRRNVFFGNRASGLQCNVDPLASLEETMKHPAMQPRAPMRETHDWAASALAFATERFGADNFPDGKGKNFLIEGNVMNRNGWRGGAALNLAGIRESVVQNNLAYGNEASGIVLWDNANPFDAELVKNPPRSPADLKGPEVLPVFGCYGDLVRANTILNHKSGRPALLVGNGSFGTRAYDNVLVNETTPSIEIDPTGIYRTDMGSNVVDKVLYEDGAAALKATAVNLPEANRNVVGASARDVAVEMQKPGDAPWVVLENGWWRLNPARPDFRPKKGGRLLAGHADPRALPPFDLLGKRRATADIGAFAE